jgi:hypothetical protein
MLSTVIAVVLAISGWAFGRARPILNLPVFVLTLFAAVTAHSAMQWAFFEGRMDVVFGDPRAPGQVVALLPIAAIEAAGLWVPILILPWTAARARGWAAIYSVTAALLAAIYHYFPFDLIVLDPALIAADGPPYLFAWLACLPAAALGALAAWLKTSREIADRDLDIST